MPDGKLNVTHQKLKTPYAAALAGLLFTVLFTSSYVLIRLSIPANPADAGAWLAERAGTVSLALRLLPFAGIAFLWFIGVVRDRLGPLEDQFFATVFFGSGLLFLAMAFVSAALAGGILATYALEEQVHRQWDVHLNPGGVVSHHQRLCRQDGRCVHDLVGDDLGPDAGSCHAGWRC